MKTVENIEYCCTTGEINKLDLYLPETDGFSTFIYFHGGGIECSDKKNIDFTETLTQKGIAVVSANYRLYPNAVYPEFIRDAASAVAWTYRHIDEYGGSKNIFVGGSSAGAYLSMMLCFDKRFLAVYNINSDDITGFIHDAGQPTTHFNVLREKGIDTKRVIVDEAAPLYHVKHNKNYPPMLFIVSDNDMTNRLEQTMVMLKTLEHFDNDMSKIKLKLMENSGHCSYLNKESENRELFENTICNFITDTAKEAKNFGGTDNVGNI